MTGCPANGRGSRIVRTLANHHKKNKSVIKSHLPGAPHGAGRGGGGTTVCSQGLLIQNRLAEWDPNRFLFPLTPAHPMLCFPSLSPEHPVLFPLTPHPYPCRLYTLHDRLQILKFLDKIICYTPTFLPRTLILGICSSPGGAGLLCVFLRQGFL